MVVVCTRKEYERSSSRLELGDDEDGAVSIDYLGERRAIRIGKVMCCRVAKKPPREGFKASTPHLFSQYLGARQESTNRSIPDSLFIQCSIPGKDTVNQKESTSMCFSTL